MLLKPSYRKSIGEWCLESNSIYYPESEPWGPNDPNDFHLEGPLTVYANEMLYVLGGADDEDYYSTDSFYRIDPFDLHMGWEDLGPLPSTGFSWAVTMYDTIYVGGGQNYIWEYNLNEQSWTQNPIDDPGDRDLYGQSAVAAEDLNMIFISGGYTLDGGFQRSSRMVLANVADGWVQWMPDLPTAGFNAGMIYQDWKVYVFGLDTGSSYNTMNVFDLTSQQGWVESYSTPFTTSRTTHTIFEDRFYFLAYESDDDSLVAYELAPSQGEWGWKELERFAELAHPYQSSGYIDAWENGGMLFWSADWVGTPDPKTFLSLYVFPGQNPCLDFKIHELDDQDEFVMVLPNNNTIGITDIEKQDADFTFQSNSTIGITDIQKQDASFTFVGNNILGITDIEKIDAVTTYTSNNTVDISDIEKVDASFTFTESTTQIPAADVTHLIVGTGDTWQKYDITDNTFDKIGGTKPSASTQYVRALLYVPEKNAYFAQLFYSTDRFYRIGFDGTVTDLGFTGRSYQMTYVPAKYSLGAQGALAAAMYFGDTVTEFDFASQDDRTWLYTSNFTGSNSVQWVPTNEKVYMPMRMQNAQGFNTYYLMEYEPDGTGYNSIADKYQSGYMKYDAFNDRLLFGRNSDDIYFINMSDFSEGVLSDHSSIINPTHIEVDPTNGDIYWANQNAGGIFRAPAGDFTNVETIEAAGAETVTALALGPDIQF